MPLLITDCSSTYSCRPSGPNSRPMPDCLKPPNGTADVERVHVDAVGAGAHARGDFEAVRDVGGPHRSGQAVVAVVGDADRVALVAVGQHGQHRAEDFLARDAHVVGGVGEQRRLHVPAAARAARPRRRGPSERPLRRRTGCSPGPGAAGVGRPADRCRSPRRWDRRPAGPTSCRPARRQPRRGGAR